MVKSIKKEYKHPTCGKLNSELNDVISELETWKEALNENYMDITLDSKNHKEKEWSELYADPHAWLDTQLLRRDLDVLDIIIDQLNRVVYKESIQDVIETKKRKRSPYLHVNKAREWVIDYVKPLILKDITSQTEIARRLNVNNELISSRVKTTYGVYWKDYVEGVQHGRY